MYFITNVFQIDNRMQYVTSHGNHGLPNLRQVVRDNNKEGI